MSLKLNKKLSDFFLVKDENAANWPVLTEGIQHQLVGNLEDNGVVDAD